MKKKSLLVVIAILSVFLCGIGTSYAIYGVPDDVPGQDQVWPMMCAKNVGSPNSLNTNWAIADLLGGSPDQNGNVATMHCVIKDVRSHPKFDFEYTWTPFDVVVGDCESLIQVLTGTVKDDLTVNIGGVDYYAGYIQCQQTTGQFGNNDVANRFMNNLYLVDAPLGFASGFNGPSLEDGSGNPSLSNLLGESGDTIQVTAGDVFARYYLNNANANSWDWWILLLGRNQYSTINVSSSRILNGVVCDEAEHCVSVVINIPDELNIISVGDHLPGAPLITTYPRAGFGAFTIDETGTAIITGSFSLTGTANVPALAPLGQLFYSLYGWSYERAQAGSVLANFDVVHPMFRTYCSGGPAGSGPSENFTQCSCVGNGCGI